MIAIFLLNWLLLYLLAQIDCYNKQQMHLKKHVHAYVPMCSVCFKVWLGPRILYWMFLVWRHMQWFLGSFPCCPFFASIWVFDQWYKVSLKIMSAIKDYSNLVYVYSFLNTKFDVIIIMMTYNILSTIWNCIAFFYIPGKGNSPIEDVWVILLLSS